MSVILIFRRGILSQLQKPRDEIASLAAWVATHLIGTALETSLTMSKTLLSPPTNSYIYLVMGALVFSQKSLMMSVSGAIGRSRVRVRSTCTAKKCVYIVDLE